MTIRSGSTNTVEGEMVGLRSNIIAQSIKIKRVKDYSLRLALTMMEPILTEGLAGLLDSGRDGIYSLTGLAGSGGHIEL